MAETFGIPGVLGSAVATSGTFTVDYPAGYNVTDFGGSNHRLFVNGAWHDLQNGRASFALGASSVTVTWSGTNTLAAGSDFVLQLDRNEDDDPAQPPVGTSKPMYVVRVNYGAPAASDDNALVLDASTAGAQTLVTANTTSDVRQGRNIIVTSGGDDSGETITVVGTDFLGNAMEETITGANAGIAAGKKAFYTVTSVTTSGNAATTMIVGWGNVFGLPLFIQSTADILGIETDGVGEAVAAAVAGATAKATATTGDVRGTVDFTTAPDGSKTMTALIAVHDLADYGVPQYTS